MNEGAGGAEENGPLSRRRIDKGREGFEKREKRRNIRRLQTAICDSDIETVTEILQEDFEVDFQYNGQTCLQVAVLEGWEEACSMLIIKGADINHSNVEGNSLLNMACWRGHIDVVRLLVNNGVDLDTQNESGKTCLHVCAIKGFNLIADILLSTGTCSTNLTNKYGQTPLYIAAQNGNDILVSKIMRAGADPNWCDHHYVTPLAAAARDGHVMVVKELLSAGADPNMRDRQGHTAVFEAADKGNTEIIRLLHQHGANLDTAAIKGVTPLLTSIAEDQVAAAKMLIELGCNVNLADKLHQAPIHAVIQKVTSTYSPNGSPHMRKLVESLVEAGADVNMKDSQSWTPIYQSALSGDVDMCELIMAQGASMTSLTKTGSSPLHSAVLGGNTQVVRMFLEAGCDVNVADFQGLHPLLTAVTFTCNTEIIRMLLDAKSDLSVVVTATKNTALHEAVYRHQTAAANLLIDYGSSLSAENIEKQMPLYLACKSGMSYVVVAMLKKGSPMSGGPRSALPIHAAALQGSGSTIQALADHGCDLNEVNEKGETPIINAIEHKNFSATRALLQSGCDLMYLHKRKGLQICCLHHANPHPHFDMEPLFVAVTQYAMDIINMLLHCYSNVPRKTIRMIHTLLQSSAELNIHFSKDQKKELYKQFAQFTHRPMALSHICRRRIRGQLTITPMWKSVQELPVGGAVKNFILMETEFEEWVELEKEKPGGTHGIVDVFRNTSEWR